MLWQSPSNDLGGNTEHPGVQIQEYAAGGTDPDVHGPALLNNVEDAQNWGRLLAKLHAQPTEWFDEGGYEGESFKSINTAQINSDCPQLKDVLAWCQDHGKPGQPTYSSGPVPLGHSLHETRNLRRGSSRLPAQLLNTSHSPTAVRRQLSDESSRAVA